MIQVDHYDYSFWEFILILLMFIMATIRFYAWARNVLEDGEDVNDE